jgi:cyanate lyase
MLKCGLQEATQNVAGFMTGHVRPFGDEVHVKEDAVYDALVAPSVYDNECELMLSVILSALTKYVVKKFKDFLPGGEFSEPTEEMKRKMQSVEKHNKFSERIFAYYDNLLRYKPHINTLASEAYIAFAINKTGKWLKEKTDEKIHELLASARKEVADIRRKFKYRQTVITERRREKLEETRQQKEAEAARKLQKQEEITNEIIFYGLWQSTDQVDRVLDTIETNKEKLKALKAQLRFRKEILKQHPDNPAIYRFSKKNNGKTVALSVEEMSENVKALVGHALNISTTPSPEIQLLVGRRVRHRFTASTTGPERWYTGTVISQVCLFRTSNYISFIFLDDITKCRLTLITLM